MSAATRLRCSAITCGRIFPHSEATKHIDGNWSEAWGQREYVHTETQCCPFCACNDCDEVVVCRSCLSAEPLDGADDCGPCIELQEPDWDERIKRYRANAPDFERARAALKTHTKEVA